MNEVSTREQDGSLTLAPGMQVQTFDGAAALLQVIARAAENPQVDVDKMQKLLDMQQQVMARQAEAAFNVAMNQAQAEMVRVATDAENSHTRSRYATYAAMDRALRPIYTRHGFSISYDTQDTDNGDFVVVVAYVSHSAGHTRTYRAKVPADGKGARGNDGVMNRTQAFGSANSYGMRYLLKLIWNVAIGEDDTDGNTTDGNMEAVAKLAESLDPLLKQARQTKTDAAALAFWKKHSKQFEQAPALYKRFKDGVAHHRADLQAKAQEAQA